MENMAKDLSYTISMCPQQIQLKAHAHANEGKRPGVPRSQPTSNTEVEKKCSRPDVAVSMASYAYRAYGLFRPSNPVPCPKPRSRPLTQSWQKCSMAAFLASVCPASKWWCSPLSTVTQEFGTSFPGSLAASPLITSPSVPRVLNSFPHLFRSPFRFPNTSPPSPAKKW